MSDTAVQPEPIPINSDIPVGEELRRAREYYGQSLEDVERALRIRSFLIDAIEHGDMERLPGRVYAIGFVRTYAEYLGFDPEKMVQMFKKQYLDNRSSKPHLSFPSADTEHRMPSTPFVLAFTAIGILFLSIYLYLQRDDRRIVTSIPSVQNILDDENIIQLAKGAILSEIAFGPPEKGKEMQFESGIRSESDVGVTLNVIQNSWIEIRDDSGEKLVSKVLQKGEQYYVPNRPDLTMTLGNAGGVEVMIDNKKLPALGYVGEIKKDISLDAETLKSLADSNQSQ